MNKYLVIDIETATDPNITQEYADYYYQVKRDKKITVDKVKMQANREHIESEYALSPKTGKVIMIGYDIVDENSVVSYMTEENYTEEKILSEFWDIIKRYVVQNGYKLVTKNGKTFDLPFIFFRSLLYNIEGVSRYSSLVRKYYTDYHVDLAEFLPGKLTELSYLLLGESLDNETGAAIGEMYREGKWDEIVAKNKQDLETTSKIYQLIQGYIL